MRSRRQRFVAQPADLAFHTTNVCDNRSGDEMRSDLTDKRHDLINRRTDDNQLRVPYCFGGCIGNMITPRLTFKL